MLVQYEPILDITILGAFLDGNVPILDVIDSQLTVYYEWHPSTYALLLCLLLLVEQLKVLSFRA